jgi:CheY-like chemotaxis protein/HPt (histidine-containing phosphotransfer) domain-containing protein
MKDMLGSLGYDFDLVADGQQALDALEARDYSLVLMDCQMPVVDGYEAARRWRRRETEASKKRLPIVAVTAHALVDERDKVLRAGMDDFLSKPVQMDPLRQMLAKWLRGARRFSPVPPAQASEQDSPKANANGQSRPSLEISGAAEERERPLLDTTTFRSQRMRELFLENTRDDLEFIQEATAIADAESLRQRAHRLKGSSYTFGAQLLGDKAAELEKLAKAGNVDVDARVAELLVLFRQTLAELKQREQTENGGRDEHQPA